MRRAGRECWGFRYGGATEEHAMRHHDLMWNPPNSRSFLPRGWESNSSSVYSSHIAAADGGHRQHDSQLVGLDVGRCAPTWQLAKRSTKPQRFRVTCPSGSVLGGHWRSTRSTLRYRAECVWRIAPENKMVVLVL